MLLPRRRVATSVSPWSASWLRLLLVWFIGWAHVTRAYQVLISSEDDNRQVCSGMWGKGKQDAFIEVLFSPSSRGQLALVIFEWQDAKYLGTDQNGQSTDNNWTNERVFICTLDALASKLCTDNELGRFIKTPASDSDDPSAGQSIWTTSVRFDPVKSAPVNEQDKALGTGPFRYDIRKTGYYCVGHVPVVLEGATRNTSYQGVVDFENVFQGHLPASEYPKVQFYFVLLLVYVGLAAAWMLLCWKHRRDLLPIQNYITATIVFLVIEMAFVWRYYAFLNNNGQPGLAGIWLVIVSALNAARNSLSLFLLLIVSMGYGVVRPTLGSTMLRIRTLAVIHFVFGLLYSLGTVMIPLDSEGFFILCFVVPLSITLTAFLMWIMFSLNSTITDLDSRRQTYKKTMFTRLYRILVMTVIVVLAFFAISTLSFSSRLDTNFGSKTWQTRWILLDAWLSVLYLVSFTLIAFLWRPTSSNTRLALSDELPTDELDADQYDVDAMEQENQVGLDKINGGHESVPLTKVGGGRMRNGRGQVMFEVGSDDDEEDAVGGMRRTSHGATGENRPLRGNDSDSENDDGRQRDLKRSD
ncbi:hypothetical protein OIO90_001039 [Microbotryomycetes sp. JL221]|nr:hypothetical protein OIO90_001039 [Microbotryomycetes sp. JL221]